MSLNGQKRASGRGSLVFQKADRTWAAPGPVRSASVNIGQSKARQRMQIRITEEQVRPSALFKIVAVGYTLGALAIFAPFFVLFLFAGLFGNTAFDGKMSPIAALFLIPPILVVQGVLFSSMSTLGLWLYCRVRAIAVVR